MGADGSGLEKMKSEANLKDGASDLEHFNAFETSQGLWILGESLQLKVRHGW